MIVKQLMYNVPNIIYRFYKLDGKSSIELYKKGEAYNCHY